MPRVQYNGVPQGASVTAASIAAAVTTDGDADTVLEALRRPGAVANASFTGSNGLGTATASTLTLTTSAACTSHADMPRLTYAHGAPPFDVDVQATLAALSGGDSNTFCPLALRDSSGNTLFLVQFRGGTRALSVYSTGSGDLIGTPTTVNVGDVLRLVVRNGVGAAYRSTDGGDTWDLLKGGVDLYGTASQNLVAINLYQNGAPGGAVTVRWSNVSVARPV